MMVFLSHVIAYHSYQQDDGGGGDGDEDEDEPKDLRSRGLCLVPVSFTLHVGNDNGADFWAPNFGMGFQ